MQKPSSAACNGGRRKAACGKRSSSTHTARAVFGSYWSSCSALAKWRPSAERIARPVCTMWVSNVRTVSSLPGKKRQSCVSDSPGYIEMLRSSSPASRRYRSARCFIKITFFGRNRDARDPSGTLGIRREDVWCAPRVQSDIYGTQYWRTRLTAWVAARATTVRHCVSMVRVKRYIKTVEKSKRRSV